MAGDYRGALGAPPMWQYPHVWLFRFVTRRGSKPGPCGLIPHPIVEWHCMQSRCA
jgi:hypothetical protein